MPKNSPVLIFDLDETILSINSFPYWARHMLWGKFGNLSIRTRIALSLKTARVLVERKLQGRSHAMAKRKLQILWQQALARDNKLVALVKLNTYLCKKMRPQMKEVMRALGDSRFDAILATAAVSEYADHLAHLLGFQHVIATPQAGPRPAPENAREQKRDHVMAFLEARQWQDRMRIFFTDHLEDMPLIKESHLVLWFGKKSNIAIINQSAPNARVINGHKLSSAEMIAVVEKA